MEAVECGAASLGIVLGYFGRYVPLEKLRVDCGVSRDGSNAQNMAAAAESYGMDVSGQTLELDQFFEEAPLPCIVFWNFNHFLVVEGFGAGKVYLNDPASGRRAVTDEEFDKGFSGVVLDFHPGAAFQKGGKRPTVRGALAKRLKGIRLAVGFCILAGLGLVAPGLAVPTFSKIFV